MSYGQGGVGRQPAWDDSRILGGLSDYEKSNINGPFGLTAEGRVVSKADFDQRQHLNIIPKNETFENCAERFTNWKSIRERKVQQLTASASQLRPQRKAEPPKLYLQGIEQLSTKTIPNAVRSVGHLKNLTNFGQPEANWHIEKHIKDILGRVGAQNKHTIKKQVETWPEGQAKNFAKEVISQYTFPPKSPPVSRTPPPSEENPRQLHQLTPPPASSPVHQPATPQKKSAYQIALDAYPESKSQATIVLSLWKLFRQDLSGLKLPDDSIKNLISILKQSSADPNHLVGIQATQPVEFRRKTVPILREFLAQCSGFGKASPKTVESLTEANLWFDDRLDEQIKTMHSLNSLNQLLGDHHNQLTPDDMMLGLAYQKLSPLNARKINALNLQQLTQVRDNLQKNPVVRELARVADGNPNQITEKTLQHCTKMKQYYSKEESSKLSADDNTLLEGVLNKVSYLELQSLIQSNRLENDLDHFFGVNSGKTSILADRLKQWNYSSQTIDQFLKSAGASVSTGGNQFSNDLKRYIYDLADRHAKTIEADSLKTLTRDSRAVKAQVGQIKSLHTVIAENKPDKVNTTLGNTGLKVHCNTVADANCGYSSVGILSGRHPKDIRQNAAQAARDMVAVEKGQRITGSQDYQQRVKNAVQSRNDLRKENIVPFFEDLSQRAEAIAVDPVFGSQTVVRNPVNNWMTDDDIQCVAVAEGLPIVFLTQPFGSDRGNEGGRECVQRYVTSDGKLHICQSEAERIQALKVLKSDQNAIALYLDRSSSENEHFMPLDKSELKIPEEKRPSPEQNNLQKQEDYTRFQVGTPKNWISRPADENYRDPRESGRRVVRQDKASPVKPSQTATVDTSYLYKESLSGSEIRKQLGANTDGVINTWKRDYPNLPEDISSASGKSKIVYKCIIPDTANDEQRNPLDMNLSTICFIGRNARKLETEDGADHCLAVAFPIGKIQNYRQFHQELTLNGEEAALQKLTKEGLAIKFDLPKNTGQ